MANKFVTVEYDKFVSRTTTKLSYNYFWKEPYGARGAGFREGYNACLRRISMPGSDSLLLDIDCCQRDWFFLRNGQLIININNVENIVLEPHESYSETRHSQTLSVNGSLVSTVSCFESCYYEINSEILLKMCNAHSLDMRLTGGNGNVETLNATGFIIHAQIFYNGCFDENAYVSTVEMYEQQLNDIQEQRIQQNKKIYNRTLWIGLAIILGPVAITLIYLLYCMIIGGL